MNQRLDKQLATDEIRIAYKSTDEDGAGEIFFIYNDIGLRANR